MDFDELEEKDWSNVQDFESNVYNPKTSMSAEQVHNSVNESIEQRTACFIYVCAYNNQSKIFFKMFRLKSSDVNMTSPSYTTRMYVHLPYQVGPPRPF